MTTHCKACGKPLDPHAPHIFTFGDGPYCSDACASPAARLVPQEPPAGKLSPDELHAWDAYFAAAVIAGHAVVAAANGADVMLSERRKR